MNERDQVISSEKLFVDQDTIYAPVVELRPKVVQTWEECEDYIRSLENETRGPSDELWFRGQRDASWGLETTLERRRWEGNTSVRDYLNLIYRIKPAIETFTDKLWSLPPMEELEMASRTPDLFLFDQQLRGLATYLTHLRHNGFPSPLLDWTRSPFVAAFTSLLRRRFRRIKWRFLYIESDHTTSK
jgi:hypothetical protein